VKILIACEFSGIVRDEFIKKGHNAISCDILPTEKEGPHYKGDVLDIINDEYDLMIAHPPCTYIANSGVRWLKNDRERILKMIKGAIFFKKILNANIKKICVENPIMHRYGKEIIEEQEAQIIQPWQHGHGETKATCLWLKNLPKLKPSKIVKGREKNILKFSPGKDRGKLRSITYKGIAKAMAEQWG